MNNPNPKIVLTKILDKTGSASVSINAPIKPMIYSAVDQGFPMIIFDIATTASATHSTSSIIEQNPPLD
jgi:hypothetical protein